MTTTTIKPALGGVVGFLLDVVQRSRSGFGVVRAEKQMKLLETLSLGGKKQLLLVSCGEERFLVGAGIDGVRTIVSVDGGKRSL